MFGYWLGADLGVFYWDSQLTRDDLSLDERLRVCQIRQKVDAYRRLSEYVTILREFPPLGAMIGIDARRNHRPPAVTSSRLCSSAVSLG